MMHGTVSDIGVPIITLSIDGQDWPAMIDTGFNGDLELPEVLRNVLKSQYAGKITSSLAGGQAIEEDVYMEKDIQEISEVVKEVRRIRHENFGEIWTRSPQIR